MPTFRHGKSTVFKLDNSGGTLTDISNVLTSVGFPREVETAEVTAFGATAKSYIVGLSDSTISFEGSYDATVDAHLSAVLGQSDSLSFEYGPEGSTAGFIKFTGESYLTSYDVTNGVGDAVTFSASLQVTGVVTRTTF